MRKKHPTEKSFVALLELFEFDDWSLECVGATVFGKEITKSQTNDDVIASITWYLSKPNVLLC